MGGWRVEWGVGGWIVKKDNSKKMERKEVEKIKMKKKLKKEK